MLTWRLPTRRAGVAGPASLSTLRPPRPASGGPSCPTFNLKFPGPTKRRARAGRGRAQEPEGVIAHTLGANEPALIRTQRVLIVQGGHPDGAGGLRSPGGGPAGLSRPSSRCGPRPGPAVSR
jgi:hypothetical protein